MDSYELVMPKKRCDQIVKHSKYERTNSGMQKFWRNKFKEMEDTRSQVSEVLTANIISMEKYLKFFTAIS